MTRAAVERAGGLVDVCSVCGSAPSREFVNPVSAVMPDNIRLCDECLRIRTEVRGERWEPVGLESA